jgi:hypothetical protein
MKVAKADRRDLDAAMMLLGLLDTVSSGYYPSDSDDNEDDPTFFDADDPKHLAQLWRRLEACLDAAPGFQGRVIFGAATMMNPGNEVIDPDDDCLSLHPRLTAALKDAERYRWLRDVGDAIWRPFALREGSSPAQADEAIDAAMAAEKPANADVTGLAPEGD